MTASTSTEHAAVASRETTTTVEIVVPVHNEEADLASSIHGLHRHLEDSHFPYPYLITIADNASTDDTWELAQVLERGITRVRAMRLPQKGRGRALNRAWMASDASVMAYMDVDLSTDLGALLPLVAPLITGHSDLAIGTRLSPSSRVSRGPKREVISRGYNLVLRGTLGVSFSDAQCGFKAIRRDAARRLLPLVEDTGWFFDTELLVLAQRAGLRIHEVPVDWVDDPGSTVDIVATAMADLRGIARLARGFAAGRIPVHRIASDLGRPQTLAPVPGVPTGLLGQGLRFGLVGVASTLAYFAVFMLLREVTGAQAANLIALVLTTLANTAANRRFTFGVHGTVHAGRHHAGGLLAFAVGLGLTSGSLWLLHHLWVASPRWIELGVLLIANAAATVFRFLALRQVIGRRRMVADGPDHGLP